MPSIPATLERDFEFRVRKDHEDFSTHSVYFPNPVLCDSPRICLVAMEPAVREGHVDSLKMDIREGYLNFLCTPEDLILHYCLYLSCGHTFEYHITDLSKGAMTPTDAKNSRTERYAKWFPLLQEEIRHFGNPKLLSFGRVPQRFLCKQGLISVTYLMHHSRNNSGRFRDHFDQNRFKRIPNDLHTKVKEFSDNIFAKVGYTARLRQQVLHDSFLSELKPWQKGMFVYYTNTIQNLTM